MSFVAYFVTRVRAEEEEEEERRHPALPHTERGALLPPNDRWKLCSPRAERAADAGAAAGAATAAFPKTLHAN